MIQTQDIDQIRSRSEKVYSNGKILDYRLYGDQEQRLEEPPMEYESEVFNPVQSFLYKRALKGLEVYTKKELRDMDTEEKHKIIKVYARTQKELMLWKHKLVIKASNEVLTLLPNSILAKSLLSYDCLNLQTANAFSFRDLGIKKDDIVEQLHKVGILPNDFYGINKNLNENKAKNL